MSEFRLSPEAQRDLAGIEEYLDLHRLDAVDAILDGLESSCALIADFPGVGRARDEIDSGLFSFPVGSYVVFYYPHTVPLGVARILHGSRDLGPAFHEPRGDP